MESVTRSCCEDIASLSRLLAMAALLPIAVGCSGSEPVLEETGTRTPESAASVPSQDAAHTAASHHSVNSAETAAVQPASEINSPATKAGLAAAPASAPEKPAIVSPEMYPASDVQLPEDASVIGVIIDGQPRAYVLEAMKQPGSQIVNDIVRETAFAVTYCPKADTVRVFSRSSAAASLTMAVGGALDAPLLIQFEGRTYEQTAGTILLDDVDFVRTEWLAWKVEHPEATVYLGSLADKFAPGAAVTPQ